MRQEKLMHYLTVPAMALTLTFFAAGVRAAIQLPAGTEVHVVFEQIVSSKSVSAGDIIPIRLKGAIEVGGITVVKDGAKGTAKVKAVESAGRVGKPGRVEVELLELLPDGFYKAEGDKKITLTAVTADGSGTIVAAGKGRKVLSLLVGFGLIIKGHQGEIPAEKMFAAKVKEDIKMIVE
ncbi:MAG TPA: hypothetical protein VN285_06910 [Candidatus Deferrimicrobium sp.]|nr:hypothetical protein [Candidatus Deferrimicrobium sp.]